MSALASGLEQLHAYADDLTDVVRDVGVQLALVRYEPSKRVTRHGAVVGVWRGRG